MSPSEKAMQSFHIFVVLGVVATAAVILRLVARLKKNGHIRADDWWIIIAWMILGGIMADAGIVTFQGGVGQHFPDLNKEQKAVFGLMIFIAQLLYFHAMTAVKISILFLYRSIFPSRRFKTTTLCVGIICVLWSLASTCTTIFACTPIPGSWNFDVTARCTDPLVQTISISMFGIATDIVVLVLPLQSIRTLHVPIRQKVRLFGLFLVGGFVCIASIMRLVGFGALDPNDMTYTILEGALWTTIEVQVAIICACIPIIYSLLPSLSQMKACFRKMIPLSREPDGSATRRNSGPGINNAFGVGEQEELTEVDTGVNVSRSADDDRITDVDRSADIDRSLNHSSNADVETQGSRHSERKKDQLARGTL